jgi:indole-3-glycerol phosphate synthase
LQASRRRGFGSPVSLHGRRDLKAMARSLQALGLTPIIAEIKPKALGRSLLPEEVGEYARAYQTCGACGISVLTEPLHFRGSLDNLRIARVTSELPVLRKDFIFDLRQIREAPADLVLLIAALGLDLESFVEEIRSWGAEPLVEVHDRREMEMALKTDASFIGINNRDLGTLEVDISTFERLAPLARDAGVFLVAESGISSSADALRMVQAGADALLVGSALMQNPQRLAELNR